MILALVCRFFRSRGDLIWWAPHIFAGEEDFLHDFNRNPMIDFDFSEVKDLLGKASRGVVSSFVSAHFLLDCPRIFCFFLEAHVGSSKYLDHLEHMWDSVDQSELDCHCSCTRSGRYVLAVIVY